MIYENEMMNEKNVFFKKRGKKKGKVLKDRKKKCVVVFNEKR